jgi:ferredoxin
MNNIFKFCRGKKEEENFMQDKTLTVLKNRCPQNHACPSVRICKAGALWQKGYKAPEVNMEKCIRCGKCVKYCPMGALALK